tara:strand:+ start:19945 stop:20616 length:672 start_codon:yes stop_codon:yes gene_type:complete
MAMRKMNLVWIALSWALIGTAHASATETCATMGATQYVDQVRYCATSVLKSQAGNHYGPGNLYDSNDQTAWCEGVRGNGEGQRISLKVVGGLAYRRLLVYNGYAKSSTSYYDNARPRTIEISTDTGLRFRHVLPDRPGEAIIDFPEVGEYWEVVIKIIDVYPGLKYKDTCLNGLVADFEYEEMLFQQQKNRSIQPGSQSAQPALKTVPPSDMIETLPDLPSLQ